MPTPSSVIKKYATLLADQKLSDKLTEGGRNGTMKMDLAVLQKVIEAKLSNAKFRERFAQDLLASGALQIRAGR